MNDSQILDRLNKFEKEVEELHIAALKDQVNNPGSIEYELRIAEATRIFLTQIKRGRKTMKLAVVK